MELIGWLVVTMLFESGFGRGWAILQRQEITVLCESASEMSLPDATFDGAVCFTMLHVAKGWKIPRRQETERAVAQQRVVHAAAEAGAEEPCVKLQLHERTDTVRSCGLDQPLLRTSQRPILDSLHTLLPGQMAL